METTCNGVTVAKKRTERNDNDGGNSIEMERKKMLYHFCEMKPRNT